MDPEIKKMLEDIKALSKDNHRMLRAIRREQWLSFAAKFIFWVLLILVPLYFLQPYLGSLPSAEQFQEALKVYQQF